MRKDELKKGMLLREGDSFFRVLDIQDEGCCLIDCVRRTMPAWENCAVLKDYLPCDIEELCQVTGVNIPDMDALSQEGQRIAYERFSLIAGILPFVSDQKMRTRVIALMASERNISKQRIRYYLCLYLVYQAVAVLVSISSMSIHAVVGVSFNVCMT